MLHEQLQTWAGYHPEVRAALRLVIVDDGSPEPAVNTLRNGDGRMLQQWGAEVYRILVDIPWNRGEARNIGARHARTDWILQMDIDHVLPAKAASALVEQRDAIKPSHWYRFRRFRIGAADHTRNKDALPRDAEYGEIKPHGDSYLCTSSMYWLAGGYNEDFSGCLGGGSPFLAFMTEIRKPVLMREDVYLHVHTTGAITDASAGLDRDTTEYVRRKAALQKAGKLKGHHHCRHPYERVL